MVRERTAAEIEADLAMTRQRLADNLTQLVAEVHPRAIVHRSVEETKRQARQAVADGKDRVRQAVDRAKAQFKDDSGWRTDSLAIAGAAVVVAVVVIAVVARKK